MALLCIHMSTEVGVPVAEKWPNSFPVNSEEPCLAPIRYSPTASVPLLPNPERTGDPEKAAWTTTTNSCPSLTKHVLMTYAYAPPGRYLLTGSNSLQLWSNSARPGDDHEAEGKPTELTIDSPPSPWRCIWLSRWGRDTVLIALCWTFGRVTLLSSRAWFLQLLFVHVLNCLFIMFIWYALLSNICAI